MGAAFANLLLTLWIIHAADSPQTIIDQAIKARGGSDQLGQIKAFQAKTHFLSRRQSRASSPINTST